MFDIIILCGGLGTRLKSVVSDIPKPMAEINKKPFLYYLLMQILRFGQNKVVLSVGHKADVIEKYFGNRFFELNITYSKEISPLGTGGAVRLAIDKVNADYVIVMNGDSYIDVNIRKFADLSIVSEAGASILLKEMNDVSRYGGVLVDNDSRIISFREKDTSLGKGLINAGVYFFKKDLLMNIPENTKYSLEKQFFPSLVSKAKIFGCIFDGSFIDIGTPESYSQAGAFFSKFKNE